MALEETIGQFEAHGVQFRIAPIGEQLYLVPPTTSNLPILNLDLPKPGNYNTSTPRSTYDERGERTVFVSIPHVKGPAISIELILTKTREYWYSGSLDDGWKPQPDEVTQRKLTVFKEPTGLKYVLE